VASNPAATAASHASGRFIALDSLRGLVALAIVFFHMGDFGWIAGLTPLRSGWMLVELFFVLSGFVIAASYGARLAQGYPRWRFMLIRFGRVYPLHIITVALFVALELLVFRPLLHEAHPWSVLPRAVFLLDAFRTQTGDFFAPVSWAVGVELVLYAFAAALFGRGRWGLAIAVALAGASAWALYSGFNVVGFGRLLQRGLLAFPVGVACYWLHQRLRQVTPGPLALSVAEGALLVALVWILAAPRKSNAWLIGFDLLFAAMVLVFARDGGIVSRALQWRPLVRLGQLSFALYMVHLLFVIVPNRFLPRLFAATGHADWVRAGRHTFGYESVAPPAWLATLITLGFATLAIGTAWLAWRFIEEPARHWSRRFAPPPAGRSAVAQVSAI
jgi:peptidoglycan/LPS O-acetylase OafA/YrhL